MNQNTLTDPPNQSAAPKPIEDWIQKKQNSELELTWNQPWLTLKLNRPAQRNALNSTILHHLKDIFTYIEAQKAIRAVILTGGQGMFCSGADLQEIAQLRATHTEALLLNNIHYGELLHRIHLCRTPVIALVDGPALGGGMGLACASDIILATYNASFGMPEPKIGIIAGQIMPYVLRKLGLVKTQEMALQGLRITGKNNEHWGLINTVFDNYNTLQQGMHTILHNILACEPTAIAKTKIMLNQLTAVNHDNINATAQAVVTATLSPEGQEGNIAFLTKRKPYWNTIS